MKKRKTEWRVFFEILETVSFSSARGSKNTQWRNDELPDSTSVFPILGGKKKKIWDLAHG